MIYKLKNQKGDTIVEVMLALSLLTMLLFTAWGLTNRATRISAAAQQRVVMTNQLKEQAEVLKSIRAGLAQGSNFASGFTTITNTASPAANPCSAFSSVTDIANPLTQPSNSFYYTVNSSGVVTRNAGSESINSNPSTRVWIQKNTQPGYVDFYIQACWVMPGGNQKFDNTFIIVRLNT